MKCSVVEEIIPQYNRGAYILQLTLKEKCMSAHHLSSCG